MSPEQSYGEIVRTSRLLRQWSRSLQRWSRATRRRAEAGLESGLRQPVPAAAGGAGRARTPPARVDPALGEVPVVDLFVILVESHRFEVKQAVRRLNVGLLSAGYPEDAERVSASDALDILETILDQRG